SGASSATSTSGRSATPSSASSSSPGPARSRSGACAASRSAGAPTSPTELRASRPGAPAGGIEVDRGADERPERVRVELLPLPDVDRPPDVPLEARVEELGRVRQGRSLEERQLHDALVGLAGA